MVTGINNQVHLINGMNSTHDSNRSIEFQIRRAQVDHLYGNLSTSLISALIVGCVFVYVLWDEVSHQNLTLWFVILLFIVLFRMVIGVKYKTHYKSIEDHDKWFNLFTIGLFFSSLLWSSSTILFLLPEKPTYVLLVVFMFTGLLSGGVSSVAVHLPAVYAYVLPFSLCLISVLLIEGGPIYFPMGLLVFLYLIANLIFANNSNKIINDSIRLSFENSQLLRDLKIEKKRAENSVIAKSNFLAAASHDLRQPIQAQTFFIDSLEDHIVDKNGEEILNKLRQSSDALSELFDGILDISKLDANTVEVNFRHVLLKNLLSSINDEFSIQANRLGLKLEINIQDIVCYTDPNLLSRILRNLLSNACKYTQAGYIELKTVENIKSNYINLSIRDTGIGIPKSEIEDIFSEYYQLNNPARDRNKGLGLGLAIVKRLCDLLDIQISVNSEINKGSTFNLHIPLGHRSKIESHPNTTYTISTDFEGLNVFVIDDEKEILNATKMVLEKWGFIFSAFESYESVVTHANKQLTPPDIVISDYRLGKEKTGIDVIYEIRRIYDEKIPAILITGDTASNKLINIAESNICVMHKPIMPAQLRNAIWQEIITQH